jgi:UDPglucose 6-dehydrogenase
MIGVIGLGFVGLTTALGFSESGIETIGYDIDYSKIGLIKSGKVPFYEPELKEALSRNLGKNFSIAENIEQLIDTSEIIFICVGTPKGNDGRADISQIKSVFDVISGRVKEPDEKIVLIKSTVPPSTTDRMHEYMYRINPNLKDKILIGMNPEFLREGHAWEDFMHPDRIVVGINCHKEGQEKIKGIYQHFEKDIIFVNPRTAEFLKYLSNSLLSTLVSFSNEMSIVAKKIGEIDVEKAFKILHLDKRLSGNPANIVSYIYPGCGYGGYCLPKDTEAIAKLSIDLGFRPALLEGNLWMNSQIMNVLLGDFIYEHADRSTKIGILGLSFKPDSDDIRETPAIQCIKILLEEGYHDLMVYDPMAMPNFARMYPDLSIAYAKNPDEVISNSEVIFILTAWREFADLDYNSKKVYNLRYMPLNQL